MTTDDAPRGRVALVTGAAQGIGRAVALALAEQGRVVIAADLLEEQAQETAELVRSAGGVAVPVHIDVTDTTGIHEALRMVEQEIGAVDILVNNAGWDDLMPFVDTDEAFWDRVIDINYKGCLRMTHALLPGMIERRWGRIVSLGSDAGRVGSSLEAVYSGTKGAIVAFMKTVAREAARYGVTANSVCPGPTDTPLVQRAIAAAPDADRVVKGMTQAIPMRRLGQPTEVATGVAFFTSDAAGFVTGQTLSVSGGLTMV